MPLSGGDTLRLSAIEARALNQFRQQRDWLKLSLFNYLRANPNATQTAAASYINGLADAYPADEVAVRDRVALLTYYVTQAGGWATVKALIATHPWEIVRQIAPELDMPAPTGAAGARLRLAGSQPWGFEQPADLMYTETLDGGLIVERRWSSASLGLAVRQRVTVDRSGPAWTYAEQPEEFI